MARSLFLDQIAADARRIHRVLMAAPEAPVTHCPGWSVTDLVHHHGDVLRWAAAIVASGERQDTEGLGPSDAAELAAWYLEAADDLVAVLADADPERDCWTFGNPPRTVSFWPRRQALEAAIHRWDAEEAAGTPTGFTGDLAAHGIGEVVEMFFPRQVRMERTPALSAPVALRATDVDQRWILPGGVPGGEPGAEIAGSTEALFLLLWRRTDLDDPALQVTGSDVLRTELHDTRFAP